jgi:hypothetical protein
MTAPGRLGSGRSDGEARCRSSDISCSRAPCCWVCCLLRTDIFRHRRTNRTLQLSIAPSSGFTRRTAGRLPCASIPARLYPNRRRKSRRPSSPLARRPCPPGSARPMPTFLRRRPSRPAGTGGAPGRSRGYRRRNRIDNWPIKPTGLRQPARPRKGHTCAKRPHPMRTVADVSFVEPLPG